MPRYFIELAYNGTDYKGWQVQQNAVTVQEVITNALGVLIKEEISLIGCGRTDTGVHASQFFAHFDIEANLDPEKLKKLAFRLNKMLPKDISIHKVFHVPDKFHARFNAISRTYEYHIHTVKDPFLNDFSWYIYGDIDVELMNKGAEALKQYNDFTSFARLHSQAKTNICRILHAGWIQLDHRLVFTITADRFLRNMVRAIVGTMVDLGRKKVTLEEFHNIIKSKDRSLAGKSAAAKGLFLKKVSYDWEKIMHE